MLGSSATQHRQRGRPRGSRSSREAILAAARRTFAEQGYDRATIRAIAVSADFDPALVIRHFGSKERLFVAAFRDAYRIQAAQFIAAQAELGVEGLGERLVRAVVEAWLKEPIARGAAAQLLAVAARSDDAASVLRAITSPESGIPRVLQALRLSQPELRAALIGSVLFGFVMGRIVVRLEPLATAELETLIECYAPVVQECLTAELPSIPSVSGQRGRCP